MKVPPIADPYVSAGVQNSRIEAPASPSSFQAAQETSTALSKRGVSVSISGPAQSMVQGGMNAGVVNMDKVTAIRATMDQGAFKVNPEVIADRLLGNAQEALRRGRA
ncbi:MAG: flagellar biosynthesis anti-sigma factor FlgM [Polaromonas sp.]|jgi:negative regulator of flagellin synthesis FlgM